jgi:hypothetical protein
VFSVDMCYRKVVDNFIILLVLKFDSHRSDRLGVVLFTNSVTESVQILYRFQKLHCLPNVMLESVLVGYKKAVDAFLILLVLKFHNHRPGSLRVMNFWWSEAMLEQISKTGCCVLSYVRTDFENCNV